MKINNKLKKSFNCLVAMLTLVYMINVPAFAVGKSVNENNDKTVSGFLNTGSGSKTLSVLNNGGFINLEPEKKYFPENSTIDLVLREVDVPSVLRIIAKEGHKNIVIDNSVMGNVSAELKKTSLNDAMNIILRSQELEARVSENTIYVASRPAMARKGLNRRYIKAFKLNNSNPVQIAQLLEVSVFNKGYKVNESAAGAAFAEIASPSASASQQQTATSTGQSSVFNSKTIKGRVEELTPGQGFGDAGRLASTIKTQENAAATKSIDISNNDGGAIVIPDTRTNSVLVAGLKEDILMAEEAIKTLDKPLRQVSIEVSLIELKKDDQNDLGLIFNGQGGQFSGGFNTPNAISGYNFTSLGNQSGITLNTINNLGKDFAIRLNALIKHDKAKLLANPQILALDDSESLIKITDQVVSKVETTITTTGTTYNTETADVGIVLNILPKIGDDNYVTMKIRPSITDPLPSVTVGNGATAVQITPISTREVILQNVRIKSGETLAIAGLTKEADEESVGQIPVLGDLPGIGKLFRNKTFEHHKKELIILVTPKIIDDSTPSRV